MKESQYKSKLKKDIIFFNEGVLIKSITDRFNKGISDLLIWHQSTSIALELKFVNKIGPRQTGILSHKFTPHQIAFISQFNSTGNKAFGVVGTPKISYIIPEKYLIDRGGQVYKSDLDRLDKIVKKKGKWELRLLNL